MLLVAEVCVQLDPKPGYRIIVADGGSSDSMPVPVRCAGHCSAVDDRLSTGTGGR